MANWTNPTVNSNYVTFVDEVKNRDVDAALMFDGTGTNLPNLTIRWNQSNSRFERLQDGTWQARILAVSGGGTGAATPSGARSALGLGLMAQQAPDAVSITGGSITGVSFSGTGTLSGNASTASTWQTARTLQIGATGKSVNGSANVTWTAAEIGTSNNTGNTVVTRNASGGFSAGTITATFSGNGSDVTNLNASNLTSGTVNAARLPSNVPLQQAETVTLGNDFSTTTTNHVLCTRIGNMITINQTQTLFLVSSTTSALSASGRIPPQYRPNNTVRHAFFITNTMYSVQIDTGGTLTISARDMATGNATNFSGVTGGVNLAYSRLS